jgi:hypothetical protein
MNGSLMDLTYIIGEEIMRSGILHMTVILFIFLSNPFSYSQDSLDIDMDAMWDQVIWEEITEVPETEEFEVEYITAVAGVRGAEAEDEALHHLYYRKSMKGPSKMELMEAYGKLRNKIDRLKDIDEKHPDIEKLSGYIKHLEKKIKNV